MEQQSVIDGTAVKYWVYNTEQKETILFLHGFRGSHRGLVEVAKLLTGYRVIIPDLPGWGESGTLRKEHTFPNYVAWLQKFIDSFHLPSYILAGHSFGASLALVYASQHPAHISRLLLIAPVVNAESFTSRLGELYYAVGARMPSPLRRKWITSAAINRVTTELITVTTNLKDRRRLVRDEQSNLAYIKDWVEIETFQSFYDVDFWALMKSLSMPTTLISASRDRMTSTATSLRMATTIPHCAHVTLKGTGHFMPIERPAVVAEAMRRAASTHST